MGEITGIAWTDHTFNPWIGCTKVSAGCANCYAKTMDDRHLFGQVGHWGPSAPRRLTSESNWRKPFRWARKAQENGIRAKVFCASMADVFDAEAPEGAQRDLFNLIHMTSDWLDWQLLTKRPENIRAVMEACCLWPEWFADHHCWLGVSVENQKAADVRIPVLLSTPAAVRFISAEPLLGPVQLDDICLDPPQRTSFFNCLDNEGLHPDDCGPVGPAEIDWVICGGESGSGARPMNPDWARSLRDQCTAAGVPFFFKQWGEWGPCENGEVTPNPEDSGCASHTFPDGTKPRCAWEQVWYVGKKNAGSLLDGVEYKQFPQMRTANGGE